MYKLKGNQGRRQGKSLEGAKLPSGVQGAEPLGGEADTFLVLKSW